MSNPVSRKTVAALALAGAAWLAAPPVQAQNVIYTNTTIRNFLCVGTDCADTETYSTTADGPLRLRNQNPGIDFEDSSSSWGNPPYPSGDWKIRTNGALAGEPNRFAVIDADADTRPFEIRGSAPSASLFVAASGRVGLGTTVPQRDLHIMGGGDRGVIRFDAADGSGPRIWDVVAGTAGFSVADMTRLSVPLSVAPGSPMHALVVTPNGVGIGTDAPEAGLHVLSRSNSGRLLIEDVASGELGQLHLKNNGTTFFTLEDTSRAAGFYTGRKWNFQNQAGTFRVTTPPGGTGEVEMMMTPAGNMYIKGQLFTGTGGTTTTCAAGCDRVFSGDYRLPSFADHMAAIRANGHLPAVGPTPETGPHNLSRMTGGILNELEKAYLYIDRLDKRMADQSREIARLRAQETRIDALEALVAEQGGTR